MLRLSALALATSANALAVGSMRMASVRAAAPSMSLYDFSGTAIDGSAKSFGDYKGKPVLILNVASL